MEFRIYITIPALPFEDEARWERLMDALERDSKDLGPVIGWHGQDAEIIVATDADDEAGAAEIATTALSSALHAAGLGDRYPAGLEVERADAEPVPA